MIAAPTAAAGLIRSTSATLDTLLPGGFTDALTRAEALVAQVDAIGDGGPRRLHQAVVACLQAGNILRSDKAVTSALFDMQLMNAGCGGAVRVHRDSLVEDAIRAHADTILASWSAKLQPHLDALTAATVALHGVEDPTVMAATAVHPGHVETWAAACEALTLAATASRGVNTIAACAHITLTSEQVVLIWSLPHTDAYDAVRRTGVKPTPWNISQAGADLHLVDSVDTLRDRIGGLEQQRQTALAVRQSNPQRPAFSTFA